MDAYSSASAGSILTGVSTVDSVILPPRCARAPLASAAPGLSSSGLSSPAPARRPRAPAPVTLRNVRLSIPRRRAMVLLLRPLLSAETVIWSMEINRSLRTVLHISPKYARVDRAMSLSGKPGAMLPLHGRQRGCLAGIEGSGWYWGVVCWSLSWALVVWLAAVGRLRRC